MHIYILIRYQCKDNNKNVEIIKKKQREAQLFDLIKYRKKMFCMKIA